MHHFIVAMSFQSVDVQEFQSDLILSEPQIGYFLMKKKNLSLILCWEDEIKSNFSPSGKFIYVKELEFFPTQDPIKSK